MLYLGDIPLSTYAIVVDNCKIPTPSLLRRIRTRAMMERSQARWDPTPIATTVSATTPSPSNSNDLEPATRGPKAPRRQISPPAKKRDVIPKQHARPSIPVRSKSPMVHSRPVQDPEHMLAEVEEGNDESETSLDVSTLPTVAMLSPMLPGRHTRMSSQSQQEVPCRESPRMPERQSSVMHKDGRSEDRTTKQEIQQILQEDDDEDESLYDVKVIQQDSLSLFEALNGSSSSKLQQEESISIFPIEKPAVPDRKPPRPTLSGRQSSFARQSSFEILPATMPTRQSSFELRHRASLTSPLSEKAVAKILEHTHIQVNMTSPAGSSPRRSQSEPQMSTGDIIGDGDNDISMGDAMVNISLPNLNLSEGVDQKIRSRSNGVQQQRDHPILPVLQTEGSPKGTCQTPPRHRAVFNINSGRGEQQEQKGLTYEAPPLLPATFSGETMFSGETLKQQNKSSSTLMESSSSSFSREKGVSQAPPRLPGTTHRLTPPPRPVSTHLVTGPPLPSMTSPTRSSNTATRRSSWTPPGICYNPFGSAAEREVRRVSIVYNPFEERAEGESPEGETHKSSSNNSTSSKGESPSPSFFSSSSAGESNDSKNNSIIVKGESPSPSFNSSCSQSAPNSPQQPHRLLHRQRRGSKSESPIRKTNINNNNEHRFRRFRQHLESLQKQKPSMPVRNSSFDSRHSTPPKTLPGRQSSFPGVNAAFTNL